LPIHAQHLQCIAVGRNQVVVLEHQHAFAMGAKQCGVRVQADDFTPGQLALQQSAFDLVDREAHHAHRMDMVYTGFPGQVQQADHAATAVQNRRG
jgi:hypothetical protein